MNDTARGRPPPRQEGANPCVEEKMTEAGAPSGHGHDDGKPDNDGRSAAERRTNETYTFERTRLFIKRPTMEDGEFHVMERETDDAHSFEKTRILFANDLLSTQRGLTQPGAGPAALSPRDTEESTRFLPVERLLSVRASTGGDETSDPQETVDSLETWAKPDRLDLSESGMLRAFVNPAWSARVLTVWRSLSMLNRLSIGLGIVVGLLALAPFVFPASQDLPEGAAEPPSPIHAAAEAPAPKQEVAATSTPHPDPTATDLAAPSHRGGEATPRAAADAVAEGRCADAVALYRKLFVHHPEIEAYREAARILQQQHIGCTERE